MSSSNSFYNGFNNSSGNGNMNPQAMPYITTITTSPATLRHAFDVLRATFANKEANDTAVMLHCLGLSQIAIPDTESLAQKLSRHVIVVSIDTEAWTNNGDEMTEIGMANFSLQDMHSVASSGDLGDHGEFLMQRVKFYFFRIREHAHQKGNGPNMRGAEGNRFGEGRFVTFPEMRDILRKCFTVPIPGMENCYCPVIVLGHAIGHDKENLNKKPLEFDVEEIGTVIRYIDSQKISRETGMSDHCNLTRGNEIGLQRLVTALQFQHSDAHTACNDIARSLMCAIQLVLRVDSHHAEAKSCKTMQQVADDLEAYSHKNFEPIGGVPKYCWRCGKVGHMIDECEVPLQCNKCLTGGRHPTNTESHTTLHCPFAAQERADERRRLHAVERAKRKAAKAPATRGDFSKRSRGYFSASNRGYPPFPLGGYSRGLDAPAQNHMSNFPIYPASSAAFQQSIPRPPQLETWSHSPYINQVAPRAFSGGYNPQFPGHHPSMNRPSSSMPQGVMTTSACWGRHGNASALPPQQRSDGTSTPQNYPNSDVANGFMIGGNPSGRGGLGDRHQAGSSDYGRHLSDHGRDHGEVNWFGRENGGHGLGRGGRGGL